MWPLRSALALRLLLRFLFFPGQYYLAGAHPYAQTVRLALAKHSHYTCLSHLLTLSHRGTGTGDSADYARLLYPHVDELGPQVRPI